jgi:flagellar hook-length control protein FliK
MNVSGALPGATAIDPAGSRSRAGDAGADVNGAAGFARALVRAGHDREPGCVMGRGDGAPTPAPDAGSEAPPSGDGSRELPPEFATPPSTPAVGMKTTPSVFPLSTPAAGTQARASASIGPPGAQATVPDVQATAPLHRTADRIGEAEPDIARTPVHADAAGWAPAGADAGPAADPLAPPPAPRLAALDAPVAVPGSAAAPSASPTPVVATPTAVAQTGRDIATATPRGVESAAIAGASQAPAAPPAPGRRSHRTQAADAALPLASQGPHRSAATSDPGGARAAAVTAVGAAATPAPVATIPVPTAIAGASQASSMVDPAVAVALVQAAAGGVDLPTTHFDSALPADDAGLPADAMPAGLAIRNPADIPSSARLQFAAPVALPADPAAGFDDGFDSRIRWMAEQRIGQAEMRVSPEGLGPIDVRLQIDGHRISAQFSAANADVRQALEAGIGRLRDMLGQHGMELADAQVGHQAPSRDGHRTVPGAARPGGADAGDEALPVTTVRVLRSRGLLDEYA